MNFLPWENSLKIVFSQKRTFLSLSANFTIASLFVQEMILLKNWSTEISFKSQNNSFCNKMCNYILQGQFDWAPMLEEASSKMYLWARSFKIIFCLCKLELWRHELFKPHHFDMVFQKHNISETTCTLISAILRAPSVFYFFNVMNLLLFKDWL